MNSKPAILQAITTKYHGATNTRGARYSARSESGVKVTITPPMEDIRVEDIHRLAAEALCAKLDWRGEMVQGATREGYVFVFTGRGPNANVNAHGHIWGSPEALADFKRDHPRDEDEQADEALPPCVLAMRCYCAGHARGNDAAEVCDTREVL